MPVRYRSNEEDSSRWLDFAFRRGDIVISTRSKSGTTWMQMISALLVFGTPELPRPLAEVSPWLDWLGASQQDVFDALDAQPHRRFIKTHTPLDGLPLDDRATYLVVARHPLDAAVSLYHQSRNIDRQRLADLTGTTTDAAAAASERPVRLHEWLRDWIESDSPAVSQLDSFNGFFHHLGDAWARRDDHNVVLVHYQDLLDDLPGEMHRVAVALDIDVPSDAIDELAHAATFSQMRDRSRELAPDPAGVLQDRSQFFRAGRSGSGAAVLDADELAVYLARAAEAAPTDLLDWLHRT